MMGDFGNFGGDDAFKDIEKKIEEEEKKRQAS